MYGHSANAKKKKRGTNIDATAAVVTPAQFRDAKKNDNARLCGDLTRITRHLNSIEECSQRLCGWCGEPCYYKCGLCGISAHNNAKKGKYPGRNCFMYLHNDAYYGLGWEDQHALFGGKRQEIRKVWTPPTDEAIEKNARHIQSIQRSVPYRLRSNVASNDGNNDDTET